MVLTTTFLGHQGWQFAAPTSCILVDPLLIEPFGHGGGVGTIYPPRILDITMMPPIDAVFLTHEHEDHFNVPSINRISRDVPLYVPLRSSSALHRFLSSLGFSVHLISGGDSVDIGDLRFTTFSADHVRRDELDEWDTSPFCVTDLSDGGTFFSAVDVSPPDAMQASLEELSAMPGLWSITNNTIDLSLLDFPVGRAPDPMALASRILADHAQRFGPTRLPLATVFCGTGFSLSDDRAFLNKRFFPLDSGALLSALSALRPRERFILPLPGTQITTVGPAIRNISDKSVFLTTAPRSQWPDRAYSADSCGQLSSKDLRPATGQENLPAGELADLTDRLRDFAAYLYGTPLFRAIYSLGPEILPKGVRPTLGIRAIDGDDSHIFAYEPSACNFVRLQEDADLGTFIVGLECFATDLLALLAARLSPAALMFGRIRRWRCNGVNLIGALDRALWQYAHPLRHPERYLELYMTLLAEEPSDVPQVAARSGTPRSSA